jgi:hypothetical protein
VAGLPESDWLAPLAGIGNTLVAELVDGLPESDWVAPLAGIGNMVVAA